jgi:adenosylcobinamide-GDP ribazoletransferase
MKKEVDIFLTAVMFLTRLPVPGRINHDANLLQQSAKYFSWVGLVVGFITSGSLVGFKQIVPIPVAVILAMVVSILVTGAFHEDGFADVCDAFGGGWTKEKIMLIMKDSRLGSYGVIGLVSLLGLKFAMLLQLAMILNNLTIVMIIVSANSLSRFAAVTLMQQYQYVTDSESAKSKLVANRKLSWSGLIVGFAGGFIPLLFLNPVFLFAIIVIILARLYLGNYFYKWIGGYTGDCLGAVQQVCEIFYYLGIMIICRFT